MVEDKSKISLKSEGRTSADCSRTQRRTTEAVGRAYHEWVIAGIVVPLLIAIVSFFHEAERNRIERDAVTALEALKLRHVKLMSTTLTTMKSGTKAPIAKTTADPAMPQLDFDLAVHTARQYAEFQIEGEAARLFHDLALSTSLARTAKLDTARLSLAEDAYKKGDFHSACYQFQEAFKAVRQSKGD